MIMRLMVVAALIAGLGVSACGKKGPLEPPKPSVAAWWRGSCRSRSAASGGSRGVGVRQLRH